MNRTWVVGDIHGCAQELEELLEALALGAGDRLISLGDLYHRGPDPYRVYQLLSEWSAVEILLGNHELALLQRVGALGKRGDGRDAPGWPATARPPSSAQLRGDRGARLAPVDPEQAQAMVDFIARRPAFLRHVQAQTILTHAYLPPAEDLSCVTPLEFVRFPRRKRADEPFWFESYRGASSVVFGHMPFPRPFIGEVEGCKRIIGLDTGCVLGGALTAYCLEQDRFEWVKAKQAYAR